MIRRATADDMPSLVRMGRDFHDATGYAEFGALFSAEVLEQTLTNLMNSDAALLLVAADDGGAYGVIGGALSQMYMSDCSFAVEMFWWVDEARRGGTAGLRLKQLFQDWGREKGAGLIVMSSMATIDGPADEIYERQGLSLMEKSWIKAL